MSTFDEYVHYAAWLIECYAVHVMDVNRLSPAVREGLLHARGRSYIV